jgi:hypothetical protein
MRHLLSNECLRTTDVRWVGMDGAAIREVGVCSEHAPECAERMSVCGPAVRRSQPQPTAANRSLGKGSIHRVFLLIAGQRPRDVLLTSETLSSVATLAALHLPQAGAPARIGRQARFPRNRNRNRNRAPPHHRPPLGAMSAGVFAV